MSLTTAQYHGKAAFIFKEIIFLDPMRLMKSLAFYFIYLIVPS